MPKLTLNEAKDRLQEILDEGAKGEEIEITEAERIADLHPGSSEMSDDFNEELPDSFWLGEEG